MSDPTKYPVDIELWKKQFKSIPDDFQKSITHLSVIRWEDINRWCNGYVISTNDGKNYVYGNKVCKWISLKHQPEQPQLIKILNQKNIIQVDYGWRYFVILTDHGQVYLASGDKDWKTNNQLKLISNRNHPIKKISCGWYHLLLLTNDNKLMAMGSNGYGQITGTIGVDSFEQIIDTGLSNIMKMCCGAGHSLAITFDYKVYCWGYNGDGRLGLNDKWKKQNKPTLLEYFNKNNIQIKDIAAGAFHSLFLSKDGSLYACGCNEYGQLGSKDLGLKSFIPIKLSLNNVTSIVSGWCFLFSIATTNDQSYYIWGLMCKSNPIEIQQSIKSFSEATSLYFSIPLTFGWIPIKNQSEEVDPNQSIIIDEQKQQRINIIEQCLVI